MRLLLLLGLFDSRIRLLLALLPRHSVQQLQGDGPLPLQDTYYSGTVPKSDTFDVCSPAIGVTKRHWLVTARGGLARVAGMSRCGIG